MADWIGSISTALAALFAAYTYFRESRRKAKQDTLDAYRELQKSVFDPLNQWIPKEIREAAEDKQCKAYKELSGYLVEIERFCVAVNQGIYDFDTFYELAHGYFDNGMLKDRIMPVLDTKLKYAKEDYYENIHKVWKRMQDKRAKRCEK